MAGLKDKRRFIDKQRLDLSKRQAVEYWLASSRRHRKRLNERQLLVSSDADRVVAVSAFQPGLAPLVGFNFGSKSDTVVNRDLHRMIAAAFSAFSKPA